jgi:hypothetical protein
MGAINFNISKGKWAYYCSLPAANDAVVALLLKASGLEADATLQDYDTVSAILAASNDEETATGYARVTLSSVTSVVDDTNNRVDADCADPSFTTSTALASGKIIFGYDGDTTGGTDANIEPIFADDFVVAVTGTATYQVASGGFARAA